MFEDSTFESNGRIRTRSRGWMIASLIFNGSILLALVVIPLIYPQALPRQMLAYLMDAPVPEPPPQPKTQTAVERAVVVQPEMQNGHIFAPSVIPIRIAMVERPEILPNIDVGDWTGATGGGGNGDNPFGGQARRPMVRPDLKAPVHLSSTIVAGLLLQKTVPLYPPIARAAGIQGTVVLEATISQAGTIENLRAVSGPAMLQQTALDAVKTWRYRPYLLNGDPVEVETTVNVVFTMGR
jgi:protein TonB